MSAKIKKYWVIEIHNRTEIIFRKWLNGNLSNNEIIVILQRLASRELSSVEIISASVRKPKRSALLDARVSGPPNGNRVMIWLPVFSGYTAARWNLSELEDRPEILPDWPAIPVK